MKNNEKYTSTTFEAALQDASLGHLHEAIKSVKGKTGKEIFPQKYELSMISVALCDAEKLFEANPHLPLKTVVTTILASFADDLSADLIVKITQKIIAKWEHLAANRRVSNQKLETVGARP